MIPDIVPVNTWAGNGSNTTFDFDFLINNDSELQVLHTSKDGFQTELKLNRDYTINQVGNEKGSYITFPILGSSYNVLGEEEKISLLLNIPIAQSSPYGTSSKLNLKALEHSLDYIVRLIQIESRKNDRAVKVKEGSGISPEDLIESLRQSEVNARDYAQTTIAKAQEAKDSADFAKSQADIATAKTQEVEDAYEGAIVDITQRHNAAIDEIDELHKNSISDINTTCQTSLQEIADAKTSAIESVNTTKTTAQNEAIQAVQEECNTSLATIDAAKKNATSELETEVAKHKADIQTFVDDVCEVAKVDAENEITSVKNTSLSEIKTAKNNSLNEINTRLDDYQKNTDDKIASNKAETDKQIESNKQEILGIQSDFEDEVNTKIQQVSDAAEKINELEEAISTAIDAANTATTKAENATNEAEKATEQATIATEQANKIKEKVDDSLLALETTTQDEIKKIKQTGFYMQDDKLYYVTSQGETKEFKTGGTLPILAILRSDYIINDIRFLRSDTFSWQDGEVYKAVYAKLEEEHNALSSVENTEGGITFKRTPSGFKIADPTQEQAILDKYYSTGIAWHYILDTTNKRFKLPRTKYGFKGLRDTVGNDIAESLPSHTHTKGDMNITAALNNICSEGSMTASGAMSLTTLTGDGVDGAKGKFYDLSFNAKNSWTGSTSAPSGNVYQNNAPVQERGTQMYLYFYVGEYTQSALDQTAGVNAELFNNKVDLNASNLTAQGRSYISGLSMPSDKHIDLTLGASGTTYTAPADGFYYLSKRATSNNQYLIIAQYTQGIAGLASRQNSYQTNVAELVWIPVKKGDSVTINYSFGGTTDRFQFIYAEGAK